MKFPSLLHVSLFACLNGLNKQACFFLMTVLAQAIKVFFANLSK